MTMLASIKALLFPTPAGGTGKGAAAAPMPGTPDFAQLLDAANPQPSATAFAPSAGVSTPSPTPSDSAAASGTAAFATIPVQPSETGEGAPPAAESVQPVPAQSRPESPAMAQPAAKAQPAAVAAPARPATSPPPATTPPPSAIEPVAASDDAAPAAPVKATAAATAVARPGHRAPMTDSAIDSEGDIETDESRASENAEPMSPSLFADGPASPSQDGTTLVEPAIAPPPAPVMIADPVDDAVEPAGAALPAISALMPQPDVAAQEASASPPDRQPPVVKTITAEAVSLLQLVRDHMTSRAASRQATEGVQSPDTDMDGAVPLAFAPQADSVAAPAPISLPVQPAALAPALPTAPVADLSASLGAQVVDMGVSGQWIDSLARDIAGLSANGAQGRFQINADTLGPIQVDIQQGDKGATVALTVATDLAEQALRQDGDRLRLDAGLAAVKISEVKIERAPAATDAARPDLPSQNPSGQHQQQAGQPAFQGQGQGRWQARENIAQSHKAADDAAVLNHAEAGDNTRDAVRARYA